MNDSLIQTGFQSIGSTDLEKTVFAIYLTILVVSPLLFGAVHTYAYCLISLGVLSGSVVLLIGNLSRNPVSGVRELRFPRTGPDLLFGLILIFLCISIIPLPSFVVAYVAPESYEIGRQSGTLWAMLAPYSHPVRLSMMRWTVYGLFYFGLTQLLNSRRRIEIVVIILIITGSFEALYGIMQTYSGSEHIWWFKKVFYRRNVTGTYINRNHFAGYMEMMIILAVCYTASLASRSRRHPCVKRKRIRRNQISRLKKRLADFLAAYLASEQKFNKRALILFAGVLMGVGLILSASRAGLAATAGALLCVSLFFVLRRSLRRQGFIVLGLFLLTGVYMLNIGIEYTSGRFQSLGRSLEFRTRWTETTLDMFNDFKLTGVGAGNFQYAYPKYQAAEDQQLLIRYAHNDWAQFLAEAGGIGFLLLIIGSGHYFYRTFKLWRRRRDPFSACLSLVIPGTLTALAIHSFFDFNLHLPANFLTLTAIVAIGNSALHLNQHSVTAKMLYREYIFPLKYTGALIGIGLLALLFWSTWATISHFIAEAHCNTVPNSTLNRDRHPPPTAIRKAIRWDRRNAAYHFKLAQALIRQRRKSMSASQTVADENLNRQETIAALKAGLNLNPFQAHEHLRLAFEYVYWSQDREDYRQQAAVADVSADRAADLAGPHNSSMHLKLGHYWVLRSFILPDTDPERQIVWDKAWQYYNAIQETDKSQVVKDKIEKYVRRFYPDFKMIQSPND
jgi:O-antigen ligase